MLCSAVDVNEIHAGLTREAASLFSAITAKARADNMIVTLHFRPSMIMVFEMQSMEDRNFIINGLRSLVSEVQLDLNAPIEVASRSSAPAVVDDTIDYKARCEKMAAQVSRFNHS